MMHRTIVVIGLFTICGILATIEATPTLVQQTILINGITNIAFHNRSIYVTGNGTLSVLDIELTVLKTIITCNNDTVPCNIASKILLIHEHRDELIMCGADLEGSCQARPLSDVETKRNLFDYHRLRVSTDENRPVVGLVTPQGNIMLGVTFGNNIETQDRYYPISNSAFKSDEGVFGFEIRQRLILSSGIDLHEYPIYFKSSFQINGFSYFVTNQKRYVGDVAFVSKLVRICQNDTSIEFNSYADVELSCMIDGVSYNLLQDAIVVDTLQDGQIFIAAFTKGTDQEDPSGDSVICYTRMDQLDGSILQAKKDFVTCTNWIEDDKRYLPNDFRSRCLPDEPSTAYLTCSTVPVTFKYVIGTTPVNLTVGLSLPSHKGYITTLSSRIVGGDNIDVHAGTSMGYIIKMNFLGMNDPLNIYEEQKIGLHPIVSIRSEGLNLYITSTSKVYKYRETYCSEYTDCEDTMTGRTPLCGWCVYSVRSTLVTDCSNGTNHWLTSRGQCIALQPQPNGKPIIPAYFEVSLYVTNFPVNAVYTTHLCKYKREEGYIDNDTQFFAHHEGIKQFTCVTPNVTVHTEATLELWAASSSDFHPDILLAQTPFIFYDCSRYLTCGNCTNTPYTDCRWCGYIRTCLLPTAACDSQLIQNYDMCPQLLPNQEYFIPSGIEKTVNFKAKQLDVSAGIKYTCILPSLNIVKDAFDWNDTSVLCNVNISTQTAIIKADYHIYIKYGNTADTLVVLDGAMNTIVTVYRCENLAKDCTRCGNLISTRYQCSWCNANCGYKDELCNQNCPNPVITKITPLDGPRQGGTHVTMYGTDIGVTLADIKSIQIEDSDCTNVNVTLDKETIDFSQPVILVIRCMTGPVASSAVLGRKGPVSIQVGSRVGGAASMFTFQEMSISGISPTYGIVSGGTRVTIYGQHLGIGNREVKVMFGSKLMNAHVYPFLPFNVASDSVNFTTRFITPTLVDNVTSLAIVNIMGTQLTNATIVYNTVMDPVINQISPKQGFFSGGTSITIKGESLTNAHEATLFLDNDAFKEEKCLIATSTKAVCQVPHYTAYLRNEDYTDHEDIFVTIDMVLALDGTKTQFELQYYLDPVFESINETNDSLDANVIDIEPEEQLTIKGKRLDSIPKVTDISVTIGIDDCVITDTTDTNITCIPPVVQPQPGIPGALYPEVNVTVGNIQVTVGYVKYVEHVVLIDSTSLTIIVVAVGISVGVVVIAVLVGILVFKRMGKRFKKLQHDTVNQQIQMDRMANMLQESREKLEAVENELTAGQYDDIDNVAITSPYEEADNYNTIEDHGYQELDSETRNSDYLEPVQAKTDMTDYMSFENN